MQPFEKAGLVPAFLWILALAARPTAVGRNARCAGACGVAAYRVPAAFERGGRPLAQAARRQRPYAIFGGPTLIGVAIDFAPIDPLKGLVLGGALNGCRGSGGDPEVPPHRSD